LSLDEPAFRTKIASLGSAIAVDYESKRETSGKSVIPWRALLELTKFSRRIAKTVRRLRPD
jgi:hypothetical protein